ncbi:MAG: hypothetical protein ACJ8EY_06415 [Sphingomicrobium sp.]
MSKESPEVAAARINAERARARMMTSAHHLQERLSPKVLAQNAWEGAKIKGADLAEDAVDAVKRRPAAAGSIAAALVLFLARHPLMDMAGKMGSGVKAKTTERKARRRRKNEDSKETETVE